MTFDKQPADHFQTERPSAARIYDYLLGGYHNFEADRTVAKQFAKLLPSIPLYMQANRAFLRRIVNYLTDQGIDQFLDIGSGIPTVGNVHEVAQKANPAARVVYVDIDSVAVRHSEQILEDNPNATVIQADVRQPQAILDHPEVRRLLDFDRPVALLLMAMLLFVTDDGEVHEVMNVLRDKLASGSYVAISHPTADDLPQEETENAKALYARSGNPVNIRSHEQIEGFFGGLQMVEPGLVYVSQWRPENSDDLFIDEPRLSGYYGGVGIKP